jgi:hypothetical protein
VRIRSAGEDVSPVRSWAPWVAAAAVGIGALAVCVWRLMPGVGFWDTAEFQMVGPVMGTAHPTGYPTYVLVGWLASVLLQPIGEPALRMNLLSAILVGVAAAVTVDLVRRLTASLALGVAAGVGLALTPIVWSIGTHADPHALHLVLLVTILWLLVRWEDGVTAGDAANRWLIAAAAVTGLATGNHSLTLLLGPGILLFVATVDRDVFRRRRLVAACIAAAAIPAVLVRFEMILRAGWLRAPFVYTDTSTWQGFWYVTTGQQFHDWFTNPLEGWGPRLANLARLSSQQLGPLAMLVLVAFGVTAVRRPRYALLTGVTMAITVFFNSVYPDGAIDRYYLGPALMAWTWLAILARGAIEAGLALLDGRRSTGVARRDRSGEWRSTAAAAVLGVLLLVPTAETFRDRADDVDETQNVGAQVWADSVLDALEPNAVVVSWWSYSTTLWYEQIVDGRRPDLFILDDRTRLDMHLEDLLLTMSIYVPKGPVYAIRNGPADLDLLAAHYLLTPIPGPVGNVYRVTAKAAAS